MMDRNGLFILEYISAAAEDFITKLVYAGPKGKEQ
jgi:hypothetical protein